MPRQYTIDVADGSMATHFKAVLGRACTIDPHRVCHPIPRGPRWFGSVRLGWVGLG
jgi:hypothetical protein